MDTRFMLLAPKVGWQGSECFGKKKYLKGLALLSGVNGIARKRWDADQHCRVNTSKSRSLTRTE